MKVKSLTKKTKRAICALLTAAIVLGNVEAKAFVAEEGIQAIEEEETETFKTEESPKEEEMEETPAIEEREDVTTVQASSNVVEENGETITESSSIEENNIDEKESDTIAAEEGMETSVFTEEGNETSTESCIIEKNNELETENNTTEESSDIQASGTYENITWSIDKKGKLLVEGTGDFAPLATDIFERRETPWYNYRYQIKSAQINVEGMTDASQMFEGCQYLKSVDLLGLNTEKIVNMSHMFSSCFDLTNLDLSSFNTENVTDMSCMFSQCNSLRSIDLSSFNTENVTDMSYMFFHCYILRSIDLSSFNTENVTDMSSMFYGCNSLRSIDLSSFNTVQVTNMQDMFCNCCSIENLDLSNFNAIQVINMRNMFASCKSLTEINIPYNISSDINVNLPREDDEVWKDNNENIYNELPTGKESSIFIVRTEKSDVIEKKSGTYKNITWSIDENGKLLVEGRGDFGEPEDGKDDFIETPWLMWCDYIKTAEVNLKGATNLSYMFLSCQNLAEVDLSGLDTENVTAMSNMFAYCENLKTLDLSGFHTQNVTTMYSMFYECHNLKSLNISNFDTKNVVNMECMFANCQSLRDLDVSNFDTKNVVDMGCMFAGCSKLIYVDVSNFNTENVTGMYSMFAGCYNLRSVDLSNFDTRNVVDMTAMFEGCSNLESLDLSSFDGSKVTHLGLFIADEKNGIETFYTPRNVSIYGALDGKWYDLKGKKYIKYPTDINYGILLAKGEKPSAVDAHIKPAKLKKIYDKNETLNLDDLRVMYYSSDGTARYLESHEYITNINDIDSLTAGEKILTITYDNGSKELTTEIKLLIVGEEGDDTEESSTIQESSSVEESSSIEESSIIQESSNVEESSSIEESSTIQESSNVEESSTIEESTTDMDDSVYEDNERSDLKSLNATISNIKAKIYDGSAYEPIVMVTAVKDGKKITLTEGADYRVLYKNNINAGTGTVIVRGNGRYKGEIDKDFTISAKPVKKLKVVTGSLAGNVSDNILSVFPIYVYDGTKLLKYDKDYTFSDYKTVDTSSAQVTVKATENGNYVGSVTIKFAVYQEDAKIINPENVVLENKEVLYTGKAIKNVEPIVTVSGTLLTKGKDYTVQYQNNKDVGTAFIVITGKGEYKGKVVMPFTIKAETVPSDAIMIKSIPAKTYSGKLQKPSITVSVQKDGKTKKLAKNKDYTVSYENNFHAGTATVIVKGKGNYEGLTKKVDFVINPQKIAKVSIKGDQGNLVLTYGKNLLKEGTDYESPVYGIVNKNKVQVTIRGKGDFTGEVTKKVKAQ